MPFIRLWRSCLSGLLCALASVPAWAEPGLRAALEQAWTRAIEVKVAEGRRIEAAASQAVAESWLREPPVVSVSEKSDRFSQNHGVREREFELALPLWLPGQRGAQQAFAASDAQDATAALVVARLAVAGELRNVFWTLAAARAERELAQNRALAAEKLAADVARREQAGELARSDGLLAQEEALLAKNLLTEANLRERQAFERYRVLTGLDQVPLPVDEVMDTASAPTPHPRLHLAQAALERALAAMAVAREDRRDPPELSLGAVQTRDGFDASGSHAVRFGVRLPLATEGRNAPRVAAANAALIRAEAEYRQTRAELEAAQREAQAALEDAEAVNRMAGMRADLAEARLALQSKAFTLGELGLAEFMRVRAAANEAALERQRAAYALSAARSRVNQTQGILP